MAVSRFAAPLIVPPVATQRFVIPAGADAVYCKEFPGHTEAAPNITGTGLAEIVRVPEFGEPVTGGLLLTTRTLYPLLLAVLEGMTAEIVPDTVPESEPISTGLF